MPTASDPGNLGRQHFDVKVPKRQLTHLLSFRLVALLVARPRGLPATAYVLARIEGQVVGAPVCGQETRQVALVPATDLVVEDTPNRLPRLREVLTRLTPGSHENHEQQYCQEAGDPATVP